MEYYLGLGLYGYDVCIEDLKSRSKKYICAQNMTILPKTLVLAVRKPCSAHSQMKQALNSFIFCITQVKIYSHFIIVNMSYNMSYHKHCMI